MSKNINRHSYFAAEEDTRMVVKELNQHMMMWGSNTSASSVFTSIMAAYWRNTSAYYSNLISPDNWITSLGFSGDQGELVRVVVPNARTLVRQFVGLVTKQRYVFEALTDVNDSNPIQTARIGKAICNNVMENHRLDLKIDKMAERAAVLGQCFISSVWRGDKGALFTADPSGDMLAYSGDVHVDVHDIYDIVYDWSIEEWDNVDWCLLKRSVNRWSLVAQFPELKDKIINQPSVKQVRQSMPNVNFLARYDNADTIYQYEFYHKPTPALPFGRRTIYLAEDCVLTDEFDNEDIPIEPVMFEKISGTGLGYPMLSSLLPAQEMQDHAFSVISTNQQAFGVQSVLNPRGNDIDVKQLEGLNFIEYTETNTPSGGKPEALQLTSTPPEVFNFIGILNNHMSNVAMINETLRGNPPSNVTSGAMAATLSANALEFLSSASKALTISIEKTMNRVVRLYQKYASTEQMVDIVGESSIAYAKSFKSEDLSSIRQVKFRQQSPIMNTVAGRLQLGDSLLNAGLIKDPKSYLMLIEGAPIESVFKQDFSEQMAVQAEIDAILEGNALIPMITDNHPKFIAAYQELLYNPYVRTNSQMTQTLVQLIQERLNLEMQLQAQPMLLAILRGTPMPQQGQLAPEAGQASAQPAPVPSKPAEPAESMV